MSNQILVLLQGKAQTGKSTIAKYLKKEYGYALVDPGNLFKCILGIGIQDFSVACQLQDRETVFEYIKAEQEYLLERYEAIKLNPGDYGYANSKHFRDTAITLAEGARLVYPDIWAKSAFMLESNFELGIGFAQSLEERLDTGSLFAMKTYGAGKIIDVKLTCTNKGEEDTRTPFQEWEVNSDLWLQYNYPIEDSLKVADAIYYEVGALLS